jgi:hypothetical protein
MVSELTYTQILQNSLKSGNITYGRGKAILVTGREGPQRFETSRLPHFLDNRLTDDDEVVSLTHR